MVVAQQALTPGTVSGLNAHGAIHRKSAPMRPWPHRAGVIAWQPAAAHEDAPQPPGYRHLHPGDGVGIESGGGSEDDPARGGGVEHAVDDDTVKMEVGIERRAETVDEGHGPEARRGA